MPRTIPLKETLTVEFKSDVKKYSDSDLFEDVVAFANTDGGDLYLGVEDDGTITGVHKDQHHFCSGVAVYPSKQAGRPADENDRRGTQPAWPPTVNQHAAGVEYVEG